MNHDIMLYFILNLRLRNAMADILLAAWKGPQEWNGSNIINDESIYYSRYSNGQWGGPLLAPGDFKSYGGPGLANHNGKVYMA
jgi:hypothetical protein